jgi:predicted nucleic acid-binding protein
MNKKVNYAWDSTVILAWLAGDSTAPLDDILEIVKEIDGGKANLIVSVNAYSEVLEVKNSKRAMDRFRETLHRSNVIIADVTAAIALKAQQIRDAGLRLKAKERRRIKTPDAQHMATAIIYKADVLHSLDNDMLQLNGSDIVDGLKIVKPVLFDGQRVIPFGS